MTVYVDQLGYMNSPTGRRHRLRICHMLPDPRTHDVDELHALAKRIGVNRDWYQNKSIPHYDLTENNRKRAIEHGAKETTLQKYILLELPE